MKSSLGCAALFLLACGTSCEPPLSPEQQAAQRWFGAHRSEAEAALAEIDAVFGQPMPEPLNLPVPNQTSSDRDSILVPHKGGRPYFFRELRSVLRWEPDAYGAPDVEYLAQLLRANQARFVATCHLVALIQEPGYETHPTITRQMLERFARGRLRDDGTRQYTLVPGVATYRLSLWDREAKRFVRTLDFEVENSPSLEWQEIPQLGSQESFRLAALADLEEQAERDLRERAQALLASAAH